MGMSAILLPDDKEEKVVEHFSLSLVGKFTYQHPNLDHIRNFFDL